MPNRRDFLKSVTRASAGMFLLGRGVRGLTALSSQQVGAKHEPVIMAGRRVKTIDVHCHVVVPEVEEFIKGTSLDSRTRTGIPNSFDRIPLGAHRIGQMDEMSIDVQAVSVNSFWYGAERDLARRLIDLQNQKLSEMCKAHPDRFVAFTSVALQFPELAAQQIEEGINHWGLHGVAISGSCEGEELSSPKFDPFWAKAEELQALVFVHPQDSANATGVSKRVQGNGVLSNVIGNPLETSMFLAHMIFEGALDRFPNVKICVAHGGGYLASYADRMDHGCLTFPAQCNKTLMKKPTEYLKQIYYDSILFTPEALRHLIAVVGPGQVGLGTDYPYPWETRPVELVMATPGLDDSQRVAMLGGTMAKLLKISA